MTAPADTVFACSTEDCPRSPVVAMKFNGHHGHVHYCPQCEAEAREWWDVATSAPLPCPYTHGDGTTWIDYPPYLDPPGGEESPTDGEAS